MSENAKKNLASADATIEADINVTVGTFAHRMARKLVEQKVKHDQSVRAAEQRHARMLQAMNTIRKALQETVKVSFGDRFFLDIDVSDWEGWPRIQLMLIDSSNPERVSHTLSAVANDGNASGSIKLLLNNERVLYELNFAQKDENEKLTAALRKSIREYLEAVAEFVLNPVDESKDTQILEVNEEDFDPIGAELKGENVFTDDPEGSDNLVEHASSANPLDDL